MLLLPRVRLEGEIQMRIQLGGCWVIFSLFLNIFFIQIHSLNTNSYSISSELKIFIYGQKVTVLTERGTEGEGGEEGRKGRGGKKRKKENEEEKGKGRKKRGKKAQNQ